MITICSHVSLPLETQRVTAAVLNWLLIGTRSQYATCIQQFLDLTQCTTHSIWWSRGFVFFAYTRHLVVKNEETYIFFRSSRGRVWLLSKHTYCYKILFLSLSLIVLPQASFLLLLSLFHSFRRSVKCGIVLIQLTFIAFSLLNTYRVNSFEFDCVCTVCVCLTWFDAKYLCVVRKKREIM